MLAGKPFSAYVVCRRYWSVNLKEATQLGTAQGGEYLDGIRFTYEGGQIRSLLSLLSYFGKGEMRERSSGSRSRRPTSSQTSGIRPRRSRTSSRTRSRPQVVSETARLLPRARVEPASCLTRLGPNHQTLLRRISPADTTATLGRFPSTVPGRAPEDAFGVCRGCG